MKQITKNKLFNFWTVLIFAASLGVPFAARAADFFVAPPVLTANLDNEIILGIDTEGESINAIDLKLNFSKEDFSIKSINEGNSLISFWIEKPAFSNEKGEISLSGIIPTGYQGREGELLKIDLTPLRLGVKNMDLGETKVLLNDGQGTEAKLNSKVLNFEVISEASSSLANKPPEAKDTEPPESFVPEIGRFPDIFNNQWFLSFATQDKNSGIAFYQIRETRYKFLSFLSFWKTADSPYLLKDQELKSYVYLKAVDRAGNAEVVIMPPRYPLEWRDNILIWAIIILVALLFAAVIFKFLILRIFRKK